MPLTDVEIQEKIDSAVGVAVAGLKTKNEELLGKVSRYKQDIADAEKTKADALEAERQAQLTAEGKHEEVLKSVKKQMQTAIDSLTADLATANETATKSTADLRGLLVDKGLATAYHEAGVVNPHLLKAIVDSSKGKAVIEYNDDGEPIVTLGGKPVGEYIESWKITDEGKSFISSGISGGGSGGDKPGGTDDYAKYFEPATQNLTKQLELKQSDPERYEQLANKNKNDTYLPLSAGGMR